MKSELEILEKLSVASNVRMSTHKQQEIWSSIELQMEQASPLKSSKRRTTIIGTSAAAVAAVAILSGTLITVSHRGSPTSPSGQSLANQNNMGKSTTQGHKITVDDIKKYYAQKNLRILSTKFYPTYHAVIVESNIDPTIANDFDWWDMNTGQQYILAGRPFYMQLEQVLSADEVVFLASGDDISSDVGFPYYIDAKRPNPNSQFTTTDKTAFFPVDTKVSFGDHKVEVVSKVTASSAGVAMGFAPIKGYEGDFAAGSYGAPQTTTSYIADKHEMVIRFKVTKLSVNAAELQGVHNAFVNSVSAQMSGTDLEVILHLSDKAKFYTGKVDNVVHPNVIFTFTSQKP